MSLLPSHAKQELITVKECLTISTANGKVAIFFHFAKNSFFKIKHSTVLCDGKRFGPKMP